MLRHPPTCEFSANQLQKSRKGNRVSPTALPCWKFPAPDVTSRKDSNVVNGGIPRGGIGCGG